MSNLIDFSIVKHTGKSGYPCIVNCLGFKSLDSATSDENNDSKNYPVYAPYLTDRSFSYENWIKFSLKLNQGEHELSSRGLRFKKEACDVGCYNITYTKVKNICLWFNVQNNPAVVIRLGQTNTYIRPINTLSTIAIEDINTYLVETDKFSNTIKIPLLFNGLNELPINNVQGQLCDQFFVFQMEVLKGLTYQMDYRPYSFNIHYELE